MKRPRGSGCEDTVTVQLSRYERESLIDSLRRMLEARWPVEKAVEKANDVAALTGIAVELCGLGLAELGAAEGPGLSEMLLVYEELGRASCTAPLIGAFIANRILEGSDDRVTQGFLAAVRAGRAIPAVALGAFDGDRMAGEASFADSKLSGSLSFVEGVAASSHLFVLASVPFGVAVVPLDDAGVTVTANPGLAVPPLSEVKVACVPTLWKQCGMDTLIDVAQVVRISTAARALGAAQRAFELALEHAKVRRQFGHVIGEFQAIQHKLAECLSRLEGARLSLSAAAEARDRGSDAWQVFADAAIAFAGPALRQVSLEAHHTLGAIGYAEEHEAPRHFRRIHADLARFGGAARARAGLANYLLLPDP